jgi:anti-anti-sigma factor
MTLFDQAATSPQALRLVTVALPGEIDFINASEVRDALALALDSGGAVVIADAAETTFCDCAGVRALIHAHRRAAASARCLRVTVSSRGVRRVLELTGDDQILDIYPTLAAATVPAHGRDAALPDRHQHAGWAGDDCA